MNSSKQTRIKSALNKLYEDYRDEYLNSPSDFFAKRRDPVLFPHRYRNFHDIEAAAFIASTFAYGNVTSLCAFIERLLGFLHPSPYAFLKDLDAVSGLAEYRPYYRLHKHKEILGLLNMLSAVYSRFGSLYEVYLRSYCNYSTIAERLDGFVSDLRRLSSEDLKFLVPSPADGSPCKRLNLFLRWMVRRDGIDFGLWEHVTPADLVMPVDTHIGRIAWHLGWIRTPSLTWKKAEAITDVLRRYDPDDPTRYDFSLCHESMRKSSFVKELASARKPVDIHRRARWVRRASS